MIPVLLNYVDENIALSLEGALVKKPLVSGSGVDEKVTV